MGNFRSFRFPFVLEICDTNIVPEIQCIIIKYSLTTA